MANNKRTRQSEAAVSNEVQNVEVPVVPENASAPVQRAPGLRAVNLRAWLSHNAHIKKFGNRRSKGCRFCRKGVAGIMAPSAKETPVDTYELAESDRAYPDRPTAPARSGDGS